MKSVSLRTIIRRLATKVSDDDPFWSVVSALRGPDVPNNAVHNPKSAEKWDKLKDLTTARLRGILGMSDCNLDIRTKPLSEVEIHLRNKLLDWAGSGHFKTHFVNAIYVLRRSGYEVPEKEAEFD